MTGAFLGICLIFAVIFPAAAATRPAPTLGLTPAGPAETVFRWRTDRCAPNHIPDAPARAFRDADGTVHLIAAHHVNRAMVGRTLDAVRVDCTIVFRAGGSPDPAALDDHVWLTAFDTVDGTTVTALGHAEFHGHRHPGLCPAGDYMACWRNAVIAAVSNDGGRSFRRAAGAAAVLPWPYDGAAGRHTGYFSPSNILRWRGRSYAFIFAEAWRGQHRGACLLRNDVPGRPTGWRAWDGRRFGVALSSASKGVCAPVPGIGSTVTSVVRHEGSGRFIAVFAGTRPHREAGRKVTGVWYVDSTDLVTWSRPALLMEMPIMFRYDCGADAVFAYPSLLDGDSASRIFDSVEARFHLYLTRFNMAGCKLPMDRDLVRLPISLRAVPTAE